MGKICIKCHLDKDLCEFGVRKAYKDGVSNTCKECERQRGREWNKTFKDRKRDIVKKYVDSNRDKVKKYRNQYNKTRKKNDILFHLTFKIRNRVYQFLRTKNLTKNNSTSNIIGCSPNELKEHLEKQFVYGMTWENRSEWHIDHIVPLSSAKTEVEIYKLFHYTNLQPLWAEDNIKKSNHHI